MRGFGTLVILAVEYAAPDVIYSQNPLCILLCYPPPPHTPPKPHSTCSWDGEEPKMQNVRQW